MIDNELRSGHFSKDSPKVSKLLHQKFSSPEVLLFNLGYSLLAKSEGITEPEIIRVVGASFNPKPARICELLILEAHTTEIDLLLAAVALCSTDPILFSEVLESEGASGVANIVSSVHAYLNKSNNTDSLTPQAQNLMAAICLDKVRHLHMSTLTVPDRISYFQYVDDHILKIISDPLASRLKIMLETSLKLYKKRITA